MKMNKKTSWKLRVGSACLCVLLIAGVAWGAGLFDRDDQTIRGEWTFEQNVKFDKDVDIDGTLSAQQYSSVFYVHSGTGGDVPQFGKSRNSPLATVEYAINRCTANKGDIIVVMPGHNEGGTAAGGTATTGMWDADIAGIKIIGFGQGSNMPTFDFDGTAATCAIGAANVTIQGLRFRPSTGSIVMGISVESGADYATFLDCDFGYQEAATDEFLIALNISTASEVTVDDCLFDAGDDDGADCAIKLIQTNVGTTIKNNIMKGEYATACIRGITIAAVDIFIHNNFLYNGDTADESDLAAQPVIELLTGSTGIISNNMVVCNVATMTASIVADGTFRFENYYNEDADDYTGAVIGTASADG